MELALLASGVKKSYGGKTALNGIDLRVDKGSCFGLLGPNGAGKSTTIKLLTGILAPDQGEIEILGRDIRREPDPVRRMVGYVPQDIALYDKLSGRRNLTFFGEMHGIRGAELRRRVGRVLEEMGLSERADDAVGTYSGGMKRRVNIAAALLHKPSLIILDEPTVGIDPQSRNHIFEMINGLKREGVTVIYSTHYMEEVEALCDRAAIIDHGRIVSQGNLKDLLEKHAVKAIYAEAEEETEPPMLQGVKSSTKQGDGWVLECERPLEAMAELSARWEGEGVKVRALELLRPSLESVFIRLTGSKLRD